MAPTENARAGDAGALKAWRHFGANNTQTDANAQALVGPRCERLIQRVHSLGPRPLAELLIEIAIGTGEPGLIADCVEAYARLDPEIVHALGADRFPPSVLCAVGLNDEASV